jgi:hypothetical protein
MSASRPKSALLVAPHMSALGGKADMVVCRSPLLRSLLGVKRTDGLHCTCLLLKLDWVAIRSELLQQFRLAQTEVGRRGTDE